MGLLPLLSAIGFPVLMAVGGWYAWRISKREARPEATKALWRDDSLDDWRTTREAEIDGDRLARLERADAVQFEGGSTGDGGEPIRIQRIGG